MSPLMETPSYGRIAGLLYLIIAICGGFSIGFLPQMLVSPDDPEATLQAIAGSSGLFQLGILGDIVVILAEVVLSVMLFVMFRAVDATFALVAMVSRLAMALVMAVMLFFNGPILSLALAGGDAGLMMTLIEVRADGVFIWQLFFGVHLLVLGCLALWSGVVPKVLAWGLAVGAFGYFIQAIDALVMPLGAGVGMGIVALLTIVTLAEVAFAIWLMARGMRVIVPIVPKGAVTA